MLVTNGKGVLKDVSKNKAEQLIEKGWEEVAVKVNKPAKQAKKPVKAEDGAQATTKGEGK